MANEMRWPERHRDPPPGLHHDGDGRPRRARPLQLPPPADRPVPGGRHPGRVGADGLSGRERGDDRARSDAPHGGGVQSRRGRRSHHVDLARGRLAGRSSSSTSGATCDVASQDIRAKIEAIRRELPDDIEPPVVQKFDPSAQPIISLALSSTTTPIDRLTVLADETIRRAAGVGAAASARCASPAGSSARSASTCIPTGCRRSACRCPRSWARCSGRTWRCPAGRVERGAREQLVRVTGRITDPRQFERRHRRQRATASPIRAARRRARSRTGTEEERSVALVNGQRAVSLDILKVVRRQHRARSPTP